MRHVDPVPAARANLKPGLAIGHQKGDRTIVGMGTRSDGIPVARPGGVVQQSQCRQGCREGRIEIALLQTKIARDRVVQVDPKPVRGIEIGQRGLPEARDVRPGIDAPEGLARKDARVIPGQIKPDIERLLPVDLIRTVVEVFRSFRRPATVVANPANLTHSKKYGRKFGYSNASISCFEF